MKRPMSIASFCAMTCNEVGFHKFLTEHLGHEYGEVSNKDDASKVVRNHCGILSRKELNEDGPAKTTWLTLQSNYKDWLRC